MSVFLFHSEPGIYRLGCALSRVMEETAVLSDRSIKAARTPFQLPLKPIRSGFRKDILYM